MIPKAGVAERRPLSIPAVRDRAVQAGLKIVFGPVFEADMLGCSFGFRPKRSVHDALQVLPTWDITGHRAREGARPTLPSRSDMCTGGGQVVVGAGFDLCDPQGQAAWCRQY